MTAGRISVTLFTLCASEWHDATMSCTLRNGTNAPHGQGGRSVGVKPRAPAIGREELGTVRGWG